MSKAVIKALKIVAPIALGIFLIAYTYNKFSEDQLKSIVYYFKNADYSFVFLSVVLGFLSHISRAKRWLYMLEPIGYTPKLPNTIMAVGIAYLLNLGVPRSGELARAFVVQKYEGIPFEKAFGTIVAERVADLLILLLLVFVAVITQTELITAYFISNFNFKNSLVFFAAILFVFGLGFLIIKKVNIPAFKKVNLFLNGIKTGFLSILKLKKISAFIFHTIFIWLMYVLMFYVCTFALAETQSISFGALLLGFVVGSFAVAFTNGGFGSYPFVVASVFLIFGIPETVGTAFGWIVWIAQFAMILIFGGLSFIVLPFYNRAKRLN